MAKNREIQLTKLDSIGDGKSFYYDPEITMVENINQLVNELDKHVESGEAEKILINLPT